MTNKYLEDVASRSTVSERTSMKRRFTNMEALLAKLRPIEEKILDLMLEKQPILDEITALRKEMVEICVHPIEHLVIKDETPETHVVVECKFCNKMMTVPK